MERHRDVTLCADIVFINQIPFFITISRNIKFGTIKVLKNRKHPTIFKRSRMRAQFTTTVASGLLWASRTTNSNPYAGIFSTSIFLCKRGCTRQLGNQSLPSSVCKRVNHFPRENPDSGLKATTRSSVRDWADFVWASKFNRTTPAPSDRPTLGWVPGLWGQFQCPST
jgi:hypothetical protein